MRVQFKPGTIFKNLQKKFFKINQQIQAQELRVIGADGKQVGILKLSQALKLAQDQNLDVVEVVPAATPPVARLVNFKKFKFLQDQKGKKGLKRTREIETKEIRVGPFISDHDLTTKVKQARRFLLQGDNFKLTVHFKPREMRHTEFGTRVIDKVKEALQDLAQIAREPKWEGRRLTAIFSKGHHISSSPRK